MKNISMKHMHTISGAGCNPNLPPYRKPDVNYYTPNNNHHAGVDMDHRGNVKGEYRYKDDNVSMGGYITANVNRPEEPVFGIHFGVKF